MKPFSPDTITYFKSWIKYNEFLSSAEFIDLIPQPIFTGLDSEAGQNVLQSLKKLLPKRCSS